MIELDWVTRRFGSVTAVDDLSFTVRPGPVTGFLGPPRHLTARRWRGGHGAADNDCMRGRRASALLLLVCVVSIATACTTSAVAPHPAKPATEHTATPEPTPSGHARGGPGCRPASPVTVFHGFLPQVEGTGHGVTLWGLLMFPHPLPARVGDQEKIVWRMTGTAWPLTLAAIGPDGTPHPLLWGPAAHLPGSTWDKPGDEWGAGYIFTEPGCWDLRAVRGGATADVWLAVISRRDT